MSLVITSGSKRVLLNSDSQILSLSGYNTNTAFIYTKMLRLNIAHKVRIHNITTHRVLISSTLVCILYKESVTSVNILHHYTTGDKVTSSLF